MQDFEAILKEVDPDAKRCCRFKNGPYDINTIMKALFEKNFEISYFNSSTKDFYDNDWKDDNLIGLLIHRKLENNIVAKVWSCVVTLLEKLGMCARSGHWFVVRKIKGKTFLLDSSLPSAKKIDVRDILKRNKEKSTTILEVRKIVKQ